MIVMDLLFIGLSAALVLASLALIRLLEKL